MADLLLRDVPHSLHRKLKSRAIQNRRSMAKEVIMLLERTLVETEEDTQLVPDPFSGSFTIDDHWLQQAAQRGGL